MESNEKRWALVLVGVLVLVGAGGILGARVLRGDSGGPGRIDGASGSVGRVDRIADLEDRLDRLEKSIAGLRDDVLRVSGSSRRGTASRATASDARPGEAGSMSLPLAAQETIEWLRDPEVRDVLMDTLEEEAELREEHRSQEVRKTATSRTQRQLDAMGESLGLNLFQQDSIGEIEEELDAKRLDIERRASELLLKPGSLDDATREEYRALMAEKRDAYSSRTDQIRSLLGDEGYKKFRGYELDQVRREDYYENISYDGFLNDKKNNRKNPAGNRAKQSEKKPRKAPAKKR